MTKTFDEESENYTTFAEHCDTEGLKIGHTINKMIRRFLKENKLKVKE